MTLEGLYITRGQLFEDVASCNSKLSKEEVFNKLFQMLIEEEVLSWEHGGYIFYMRNSDYHSQRL